MQIQILPKKGPMSIQANRRAPLQILIGVVVQKQLLLPKNSHIMRIQYSNILLLFLNKSCFDSVKGVHGYPGFNIE